MHLRLLFGFLPLFTAAAALADGYVVPKDIAPGFYVVNFHEDGNTTTERVEVDAAPQTVNLPEKRSLLSTGSAKYARQLTKRATIGSTGRVMAEHDQYNSLTLAWRNYFGGGGTLEGRHIWFFTSDQLVLAVCVYGTGHLSLAGHVVDDFNGLLDQQLGFWHTGWGNEVLYTFWRDYRGIQICGNLNGGFSLSEP
ncbi:hypothetical protein B0T18DRAFT_444879 [Schizothecium vesticola]|uniref:Uncharacterized protein n=1 Tax=Schizothecium vesticola TaxID=314040 RepID=A0AA40F0J6_9PEZI|nr:hypothetical protein B0T18DRAFT_444879 [Schizothecium vesticola]